MKWRVDDHHAGAAAAPQESPQKGPAVVVQQAFVPVVHHQIGDDHDDVTIRVRALQPNHELDEGSEEAPVAGGKDGQLPCCASLLQEPVATTTIGTSRLGISMGAIVSAEPLRTAVGDRESATSRGDNCAGAMSVPRIANGCDTWTRTETHERSSREA